MSGPHEDTASAVQRGAPRERPRRSGQKQRLAVLPALVVPLDAEHEQAAVAALVELLAAWLQHQRARSPQQPASSPIDQAA
jgi:hypothetical protein